MQPGVRRAAKGGIHTVYQGYRIKQESDFQPGALGLVAFQQRPRGFEQGSGRRVLAHQQVAQVRCQAAREGLGRETFAQHVVQQQQC